MKLLNNVHRSFGLFMFVALMVAAATNAIAAEPGAVELSATAAKVVTVTDELGNEKTELVAPEVVVPGDKIAYTISAKKRLDG